jgi:hypothetical protein
MECTSTAKPACNNSPTTEVVGKTWPAVSACSHPKTAPTAVSTNAPSKSVTKSPAESEVLSAWYPTARKMGVVVVVSSSSPDPKASPLSGHDVGAVADSESSGVGAAVGRAVVDGSTDDEVMGKALGPTEGANEGASEGINDGESDGTKEASGVAMLVGIDGGVVGGQDGVAGGPPIDIDIEWERSMMRIRVSAMSQTLQEKRDHYLEGDSTTHEKRKPNMIN